MLAFLPFFPVLHGVTGNVFREYSLSASFNRAEILVPESFSCLSAYDLCQMDWAFPQYLLKANSDSREIGCLSLGSQVTM